MNITLKQVEYFIALVCERNFGRAAALMNISQPALSVQIKELEDRLGAQLVERQSRDVVPTPFGRMILDHCYAIQNDVRALDCLLYTSPSPRDLSTSRMPSSA